MFIISFVFFNNFRERYYCYYYFLDKAIEVWEFKEFIKLVNSIVGIRILFRVGVDYKWFRF